MMRGCFISVEGGEGVGKSTQMKALAAAITAAGKQLVVTREPGGTPGAETIRNLVLSAEGEGWTSHSEALLFAAARADHVRRLILPALEQEKWVLCDRFIDSSRAYQGFALGMGDAEIMALHAFGSGGLLPDRTLVLDLPPDEATRRALVRDAGQSDRIGGRDNSFHMAVCAAFRQISSQEPDRVRLVDASGSAEIVTARLLDQLQDLLDQ
ncbi:dTMP kinase [Sphingorhabdus sp.]|uniref:dTMP kinase n=2 Tax=Sphingorhabdus sp. TaxID=1902408 RepID=UPI003BAEE2C5|nr:dTMP kinase [Sphingomonadales bacterium]